MTKRDQGILILLSGECREAGRRERFLSKVQAGQPDECWPWTSVRSRRGYGIFRMDHEREHFTISAHRAAWAIANGRVPEHGVLHHCDNPPCCNPAHLYDGTQKDNARDAIERGRWKPGTYSDGPPPGLGNAASTAKWRARRELLRPLVISFASLYSAGSETLDSIAERVGCDKHAVADLLRDGGVTVPRLTVRVVDGVELRECGRCRRWKPTRRFNLRGKVRGGERRLYHSYCKACELEAQRLRRSAATEAS